MRDPDTILGYSPDPSTGEWRAFGPARGIVTRAFILCAECGQAIAGVGGPRLGSLCVTCYNNLPLVNFAKGEDIK
jgi:hypothetical protein